MMLGWFQRLGLILYSCFFLGSVIDVHGLDAKDFNAKAKAAAVSEIDAFMNRLRLELMRDGGQDRKQARICSRGKLCSSLNINRCANDVIFSLCHLICEDTDIGFNTSPCMLEFQNRWGFNAIEGAFKDAKTPLDRLEAAILEPNKTSIDTYAICDVLCHTIQDRGLYPFIRGDERRLEKACKKGCGTPIPVHD